ncbi:MAG: hypothetical protein GC191_06095 [Azospirillum sp.]|nr:hypothetical protein [Azospirillum sp.]
MSNPDSQDQARPAGDISLARSVLALMLVLAACVGAPAPRERLFRLADPEPLIQRGPLAVDAAIEVDTFRGRGLLARERGIVYRDLAIPDELQLYPDYWWEEDAPAMIRGAVVHCLRDAGLFREVVGRESRTRARYVLAGTLDRLEQRVDHGRSEAAIGLEVTVTNTDDRSRQFERRYQFTEPAADARVETLLPAFNRGLERLCIELVGDLERLTSR